MIVFERFVEGYSSYAGYLWYEITHPSWSNYFYWLLIVSLFFFLLEVIIPWRKKQNVFRKDFWMDMFYMFFNFFLFSLIIYNAVSNVFVDLINSGFETLTSLDLKSINPLYSYPHWAVLIIAFLLRDFIQWWIHRLLHFVPRFWEFHKVHHSVEEMGFAAHLRYHWMENVIYRSIEYIPLAFIGIGLHDFFVMHIFALTIGHYNHSNISISGKVTGGVFGGLIGIVVSQSLLDVEILSDASMGLQAISFASSITAGIILLGPFMKYLFNSPEMHIWHHAYEIPKERKYGVNFGISLALWDYMFKTNYMPKTGRDIRLGFPEIETFPKDFKSQAKYGFGRIKT